MFTIYRKSVGGRVFDRYYQLRENAKGELHNELVQLIEHGWKVISHTDHFNTEKGLYIYEYRLITPERENATLSLIEGHFVDN